MFKRTIFCVWVILAGIFCWSICPAFAGGSAQQTANNNSNKNPYQQRHEEALRYLSDVVDARIQVDRKFKNYVDGVVKYNNDMNDWAKRKREERKGGK